MCYWNILDTPQHLGTNIEFGDVRKDVNLKELVKRLPTSIWSQDRRSSRKRASESFSGIRCDVHISYRSCLEHLSTTALSFASFPFSEPQANIVKGIFDSCATDCGVAVSSWFSWHPNWSNRILENWVQEVGLPGMSPIPSWITSAQNCDGSGDCVQSEVHRESPIVFEGSWR